MSERFKAEEQGTAMASAAAAVLLPADACLALCTQLPRAADLDAALATIEGVRHGLLGEGLLTVNANLSCGSDAQVVELQRIWSSNPAAYPPAGRKRKTLTPWTRQLLLRGEVFVGEGAEALAQVFDDHALIASLGLCAVVNVPLPGRDGMVLATFNVLGRRPRWQPEEVLLIRLLARFAAPAVERAVALVAPG